jgi:hypothetical protein
MIDGWVKILPAADGFLPMSSAVISENEEFVVIEVIAAILQFEY